jgi:hypothetical protein
MELSASSASKIVKWNRACVKELEKKYVQARVNAASAKAGVLKLWKRQPLEPKRVSAHLELNY